MGKVDMQARRESVRDPGGRVLPPFTFGYEWECQAPGCGVPVLVSDDGGIVAMRPARLVIRARVERGDGPSNYDATRQQVAVAQKQQPSELNWNGLAEERGWQTAPAVICPACLAGHTVLEHRRRGGSA